MAADTLVILSDSTTPTPALQFNLTVLAMAIEDDLDNITLILDMCCMEMSEDLTDLCCNATVQEIMEVPEDSPLLENANGMSTVPMDASSTTSPGMDSSSTMSPGMDASSTTSPTMDASSTTSPGMDASSTTSPGMDASSSTSPGMDASSTMSPAMDASSTTSPNPTVTMAPGPVIGGNNC